MDEYLKNKRNSKTKSRHSFAQGSSDSRRKSTPCSEDVNALKIRITCLEVENSSLKNDFSLFREQNLQRTERLERELQNLESTNKDLMSIITEMKNELVRLQASVLENVTGIANPINFAQREDPMVEEETKSNNYSSPVVVSDDDLSENEEDNRNIENVPGEEFCMQHYTRLPRLLMTMEKGKSLEENMINKANSLLLSQELIRAPKSYEPPTSPLVTNKFEPPSLFANFFVIGNSEEAVVQDLKTRPGPETGKIRLLNSQIIFNLAEKIQMLENVTPCGIEDLLTPKGIEIKRASSFAQSDKIFEKVILKTTRKHKKRFICPLMPHSLNIDNAEWEDTVKAINPQKKLYAFCIRKKDFWIMDGQKKNTNYFLHTNVIYCLLTYYPYPELMFNILTTILNIIRKKRKERYHRLSPKHTKPVSLTAHNDILLGHIVSYLRSFMGVIAPSFGSLFEYLYTDKANLDPYRMRYRYPNEKDGYLELANWKSTAIFSMFGLHDLQLILSAILLDKQIVFFSENATLLTAAINTFLGLLYPLKYISDVIPILGFKNVNICKPPSRIAQPSIIGIQRKEKYFHEKQLNENLTALFVFLDSKTIFRNVENEYISKFTTFDFVNEQLENLYRQINTGTNFQIITKYSALAAVQTEFLTISNTDQINTSQIQVRALQAENPSSKLVFKEIKTWMKNNIINYLEILKPRQSELNYKVFEKQINEIVRNESTNRFFQEFKRAKGFLNYPY